MFSVRPTTTAMAVTSPNAYNDGASHHVVATFTANEMKLYVDGQQVAARTDVPQRAGHSTAGGGSAGTRSAACPPRPPPATGTACSTRSRSTRPRSARRPSQQHYDIGHGNPINQAPTASFTAVPTGLDVAVNATASTDPDGTVAGYAWDFGDGQTGTGATAQHTYAAGGTYTITLTVTDNDGATASTTRAVTVADTPAGPVTVAADAFGRTVASGWGSADTGGAWTVAGPGTTPSVADGAGRLGAAVGRTGQLRLNSVANQDTDLTTTIWVETMPTGGGVYLGRVGAGRRRQRVPRPDPDHGRRLGAGVDHQGGRRHRDDAGQLGHGGRADLHRGQQLNLRTQADRRQPDHGAGQGVGGRHDRAGRLAAHGHRQHAPRCRARARSGSTATCPAAPPPR